MRTADGSYATSGQVAAAYHAKVTPPGKYLFEASRHSAVTGRASRQS